MAINPPSSSPPRPTPHPAPAKILSAQQETRLANLQVEAKIRIEGTVNALVKQITPLSEHQRQILFAGSSGKKNETTKPASTKQLSEKPQSEKPNSFPAKTQLYLAEIKLRNIQQLVVTNKALTIGEQISVKLSANNQLQIIETNPKKTGSSKSRHAGNSPLTQDPIQTKNQRLPQLNSKPEATPKTNKIQIGLAVNSLREALPKQSPSSTLISLAGKLNALPPAVLSKLLSPQQKTLVDEISRIPRTPAQLTNPQTLKQAISNSGVFLENKINQFVKTKTNTETATKNHIQQKNLLTNPASNTDPLTKNQESMEKPLIRPLALNTIKTKPNNTFSIPKVASRTPLNTEEIIPKPQLETNTKSVIELKVGKNNLPQKTITLKNNDHQELKELEHQRRRVISTEDKPQPKTRVQIFHVKTQDPTPSLRKTNLDRTSTSTESPQKMVSGKLVSQNPPSQNISEKLTILKTTQEKAVRGNITSGKTSIDTARAPTKHTSEIIPPSKNVNEDQKSILLLAKEIFGNLPGDTAETLLKNFNQAPDKNSASNLNKLLKPFLQNALNANTYETEGKEFSNNKSVQELQQQLLAQLRFGVGATLARLQVLQVQSLLAKLSGGDSSQQNTQQIQTEIPVQYQNSIHQVGVEIEEEWVNKETSNSDEEDSRSKRWSVMLSFKLPEKGEFYAKLRIIEETVSVQFWADKIETLKLAEKNIAPLYRELSSQGVHVDDIQCVPGKPPTKKIKLEYSLVDLRT